MVDNADFQFHKKICNKDAFWQPIIIIRQFSEAKCEIGYAFVQCGVDPTIGRLEQKCNQFQFFSSMSCLIIIIS